MGFLGIGTWEILLILVLALVIMGPGKLTEFARTLGKTVRAIKKASADLTATVTREIALQEKEPPPSELREAGNVKAGEAPAATSKSATQSQDDQPTKPGEASAPK